MKSKLILLLSALALAAVAETYTVGIYDWGNHLLTTFDNVILVTNHEPHCFLIRYVENGKTNDFHAWLVPIKVITNNPPSKATTPPSKPK